MKFCDLEVGAVVYDRWWPWQLLRVVSLLKTRARFDPITGGDSRARVVYDRAHVQFLEKYQGPCRRRHGRE